ncbi:MAG: hypothetical protein A4E51_01938 [Methanosaeta sp. PtaU1.Bin055]|nr:MAG: hypothetical protein A4E51_01938 [Methanosaeta sp. PtaU1.Bin055]
MYSFADFARASIFGPPGWGRPTCRANLSRAFPTDMSRVSPNMRYLPRLRARTWEFPPLT